MTFSVPDVGLPPVRMYVSLEPGQRADGRRVLFLTLTVRGAPGGAKMGDAVQFMDQAHDHLVRSFSELAPEPMHVAWERE